MDDMSFEITLSSVTAATVHNIMELNGWEEDYAFERFTESYVYSLLENEETKMWQFSPLLLAMLFNDERAGCLRIPEV